MTSAVPQDLIDSVVRAMNPVEVWLFGSHARGEAHDGSDVDLLVVVEDGDEGRAGQARSSARNGFTGPLDLLITSRSRFEKRRRVFGTLAEIVDHEGRRLYYRDEGVDPVSEFLNRARVDVETARDALAKGNIEPAAFHAQQAWEKLLKGRLVQIGVRPKKTHQLAELTAAAHDLPRPTATAEDIISSWAVGGRYGFDQVDEPAPTPEEVAAVLDEAERYLGAG